MPQLKVPAEGGTAISHGEAVHSEIGAADKILRKGNMPTIKEIYDIEQENIGVIQFSGISKLFLDFIASSL